MKRLTIPGSGTESRATKPARVSAPATIGDAAFGASREETGADLLEAAQEAEIEQQATLEAAPVEQSYPETLALYVQAKHDQVGHIEDRLENLIDRQQTQASAPGRLSLPGSKRAWQNQQAQQQARLQTLHARLEAVREIKEGMGLHSPKLEELATRKMRTENPELASDWDAMREAARRHELLMRKQEQERKQSQAQERPGRSQTLDLSARTA
ncbi:IncP plasmid survival protein KfrC [Verminephrobacter eiseniae]|uniref:IncP plasmid survival protein KfrC n=1 Tax=Verminephrobacter eiseniae TaxID=364317 RepID=UPI00223804EC|nr:IncP plasmid survival protein KfrC [Verminephrobacter eiseniae]MCW5239077.1 conjugal transfer protein [Verminephrobacter eiseniae]